MADEIIQIRANGVELSVQVSGSGPAVVLAHGFPELGYSWRHQVPALTAAGYRVIVPDLRGYGRSSQPADVESYDVLTLGRDLIGLLDVLGEDDAVFVGHDWGANVVWSVALAHPERVRGVAGLSVPFTPPPPVAPLSILRRRHGDDFYIAWFQEPGVADAVLARDVQLTMLLAITGRASLQSLADPQAERPPLPDWMTPADLDVYVTAYERSGFTGALNYYRNIDRNWELSQSLPTRIDRPAMFLTGSRDVVATFMPADHLPEVVTDLRANIVVDGAGHWVQQERPADVSAALLAFLDGL
ncbi:MAG TPA: alpha/beta hydrolase [Trebonia sp.]|nr:alpha/beta hydrolase [Trebonia sp.]